MTEHIDPLSAEALAVPLPADFVPAGDRYNLAERLSAAHEAAPRIVGEPYDPAALAVATQTRRRPFLWGTLFAASLALHFSGTYFFIKPPMTAMIAGDGPTTLPVLGNAFTNTRAAGEDVAEPVETTPVETVEARPAVQPQQSVAQTPVPPTETPPVAPSEALPVGPETVTVAPARQQSETVPPETTEPVEAAEPVEPAAEVGPVTQEVEAIAPEPEPIENAPIPTPRPEPPQPAPEPEPQPEPEPEPAPQPRQQGNQGQQDANRTAGTDTGRATQGQAGGSGGSGGAPNTAGNAAVTNYPGEIVSRLRRALRYPSAARRDRLSGEALVSFTVTANGGVGGISIARSSGFPILDQAAIETVQRAAPFPAIPPAAGRSSWQFSVPLAFAR